MRRTVRRKRPDRFSPQCPHSWKGSSPRKFLILFMSPMSPLSPLENKIRGYRKRGKSKGIPPLPLLSPPLHFPGGDTGDTGDSCVFYDLRAERVEYGWGH